MLKTSTACSDKTNEPPDLPIFRGARAAVRVGLKHRAAARTGRHGELHDAEIDQCAGFRNKRSPIHAVVLPTIRSRNVGIARSLPHAFVSWISSVMQRLDVQLSRTRRAGSPAARIFRAQCGGLMILHTLAGEDGHQAMSDKHVASIGIYTAAVTI